MQEMEVVLMEVEGMVRVVGLKKGRVFCLCEGGMNYDEEFGDFGMWCLVEEERLDDVNEIHYCSIIAR